MVDPSTLKEMVAGSVARYGDHVALRYKQSGVWQNRTYHDLIVRIRQVAEVLGRHQVQPGDRVALYRENSEEWPEIYFGIVGIGAIAVPVDTKLAVREVAHILRDSGARLIFSESKFFPVIHESKAGLDPEPVLYLKDASNAGLTTDEQDAVLDYDQALQEAAPAAEREACFYLQQDPEPDATASIIYTSGTTGRQKGAMLSHANFLANVQDCQQVARLYADDNFLLILPLHHALAFTANLLLPLSGGAAISFVENLRTIGENVREVSPTVLIGVPLLFEKMYGRIMNQLRKRTVVYRLFRMGLRAPVVKAIRRQLGGRLRLAVVGAAPCDPELLHGFSQCGILMAEGYGLTETAPVLTMNPLDAPRPGTAGKPLSSVEIKIISPNQEGVGEIAARGPNIMQGYYNNPEATLDVFQEGWLLTGDLGRMDDQGYVIITGRKKNLIVNREGKNIYPEEVEACIIHSPYIAECLVLGFGVPNAAVGERVGIIVVPDQEKLDAHARDIEHRLSNEEVNNLMRNEVKRCSTGLADYKRPRRVQIRMEELQKTSTQKVKRYLYVMDSVPVEHE